MVNGYLIYKPTRNTPPPLRMTPESFGMMVARYKIEKLKVKNYNMGLPFWYTRLYCWLFG